MKKIVLGLFVISFTAHFAHAIDAYQGQKAATKSEYLWSQISQGPYKKLPKMTFFPEDRSKVKVVGKAIGALSSLGKSFDHVGDEMPKGRIKIIHAYGSVAMVDFRVNEGTPFTGLFASGAQGVVRLSLGVPHATMKSFVPGMAIKLFVDGSPSKNMHVMEALEGQGEDQNFFKHTFTNKLPEPIEGSSKAGKWFFEKFVENATYLTVDHVASVEANGKLVKDVRAPHQIFFDPTKASQIDSKADDFRKELSKIPSGTELYKVYGKIEDVKGDVLISIGSIVTTSKFVASEYGDRVLYFQHEGSYRRTFWKGQRILED